MGNVIVSLPSARFQPRIYGVGAWTDNLHFAYDLVATLQPRVVVELGTDRGESYFAFCQSTLENRTATGCFAVDTWRGDEQAGVYDETTWREVSTHNEAHYAAFSTLLRESFDDALSRFELESIDLLHLDGLHTEEAVRHDVKCWLPKLRPGGIFLMHDVSVRERNFGVWKVWDELRTSGQSYTFADGPGLGVWQKPPASQLPSPVEALLRGNASAMEMSAYYRHQARELQERIARHWTDRTIGQTAAGQQTIIQVFHTRDGSHRGDEYVLARIGHDEWKNVRIALPSGAGAAPLRIDFVSPFTTIDVEAIELVSGGQIVWTAREAALRDAVKSFGDADAVAGPSALRIRVTGVDPQLHLPPVDLSPDLPASVQLRLRVNTGAAQ